MRQPIGKPGDDRAGDDDEQPERDPGAQERRQGKSLLLRLLEALDFFRDDTLDHVFRMEEIFKKISEEKKPDSDE